MEDPIGYANYYLVRYDSANSLIDRLVKAPADAWGDPTEPFDNSPGRRAIERDSYNTASDRLKDPKLRDGLVSALEGLEGDKSLEAARVKGELKRAIASLQ
jgi:hypothetical protein